MKKFRSGFVPLLSLFVLGILTLGLFATMYLVQNKQIFQNKAAGTDDIIDDFNDNTGMTQSFSGIPIATYSVANGLLTITHQPRDFYNSTTVSKDYVVDLSRPTTFSFRFKMAEYLLGQDMYTTIRFYKNGDRTKPLDFTIGINSEQHWNTNYFNGINFPVCEEKTTDNEFFISVSKDLLPNAPDTRLHYPTGYTKKYTDWTTFTLRYDPGKFSLYVDDKLVDNLHPIDDPNATVDLTTNALTTTLLTPITLKTTTLIDGGEHNYPGNKFGVRGRGCYALMTPAIPSVIAYPAKFKDTNGLSLKQPWMNKFDVIAKIVTDAIHNKYSYVLPYQIPKSATSPMPADYIPETHPIKFYSYLTQFYDPDPALKNTVSQAIWNGIYGGTVDFETAVYMGIIDLPLENHTIWKYNPTGTRDTMAKKLTALKSSYAPSMPLAKRFVFDIVYSVGGVPDIVHLGYLSPEDVNQNSIWPYLSASDQAAIPKPSQQKNSVFYWDYFSMSHPSVPITPSPTPTPPANPGYLSVTYRCLNLSDPQLGSFSTPQATQSYPSCQSAASIINDLKQRCNSGGQTCLPGPTTTQCPASYTLQTPCTY